MDINTKGSSRPGTEPDGTPLLFLSCILFVAIAGIVVLSVYLAGHLEFASEAPSQNVGSDRSPGRTYQYTLAFTALAGILGSLLRSAAYLLGYRHLKPRERRQWRLEAVVGPLLGAIAGMGAYLLVQTVLVVNPAAVNYSGQYVLSTICGALAIGGVGRTIERGLLRGGLSRSGILGSQVSTSVPVLDRIERTIEQRIAEYTLYNYDGTLYVDVDYIGSQQYVVRFYFDSGDGDYKRDSPSSADEYTNEHGRRQGRQWARVSVVGGVDSDHVPFTVTLVSDEWKAIPAESPIMVPRSGRSDLREVFIDRYDGFADSGRVSRAAVPLEISQGSQSIQALPIVLDVG